MKKFLSKLPKILVFIVPFLLGTAGFMAAGEKPVDALFTSLLLYVLQISEPTPNVLAEIARWTAPLVTASGVLLLLSSAWSDLRNLLRSFRENSVAVYGPSPEKDALLEKLGKCGIDGGEKLVRAHRYVLLGEEEENIRFYLENRDALQKKTVYMRCSTLPVQSAGDPNLRLFCAEETAARQYWKEHCLYEESAAKNHRLKLVFLGFGRLGEELLTFGLQDNIFAPDQRIEYHIFGEENHFTALHPQLSEISDPVLFHADAWEQNLPLLNDADRVIVLTAQDQLLLLRKLLSATTRSRIDVFLSDNGYELLAGKERIFPYFWKKETEQPEHIFSERLYERAKRLNLRYANLYNDVEENDETKESEWQKLDTFTRYSNISSADYHEICLIMSKIIGCAPEKMMETLAELEHIRWCRYHYLNNWKYGIPQNAKAKDPALRIHKDLVPYDALSDDEKQKDRDSVLVLLTVEL